MKNNINIRELERWLKSSLKNKVSIDNRSVIAYLMMGFAGLMMSTIANAGWVNKWGEIKYWPKASGNADAFTYGWTAEENVTGEGSVMIAKGDRINQKLQNSVVIGYGGGVPSGSGINAETQRLKIDVGEGGHGIVAIGSVRVSSNPHGVGETGNGGQAVAIGNDVTSTSQAVAIGNNTYALGNAAIAIGSDDIISYRDKLTKYDYNTYLKPLYDSIDSKHTSYGIGEGASNDIYSPNVAGGIGSISIGSRSMAYKDGSTALGTLAYALGKGSTALGTQSRAEGEGSIAVGNKTRNFAKEALAIGNDSQILNVGGTAVGLRARSGGEGSIAIGTDVYANVIMNTDPIIKSKLVDREMGTKSTTITDVENTVKDNKAINPELTKFHDIEGIIKTTANQKNAIVIGTRSVATGDNAMALGRGAFAMANNAFGIGSYSYADHVNAMAIGTSSRALAENSITVGAGSVATANAKNATVLGTNSGVGGENSSVVGANSEAFSKNTLIYGNSTKVGDLNSTNNTDNNIAIGNNISIGSGVTNSMAYGPNTRIGDKNRVTNSNIDSSTAFGSGATIERLYNGLTADKMTNAQAKAAADADNKFMYTGNNAMAIGNYSRAVLENSVALGVRSDTDYTYSDLLQPGWTARGSIAVPTSGQTGVISVGSKGQERRIVNVASGYRDTDAVNVIQLRTLEETVTNKVDSIESGMHYLSVNKEGDDFNGEKGSKKVTQLIEREKNFNQYVRYRIQQIQLQARQQWQGEKFNEESLREIDRKVTELGADTEITRVATALATKTISPTVPAGKSAAEAYKDLVNELETIRYDLVEKDRTDLSKIDGKYQKGKYNELLAGEDIAALKRVTNYSNEGGQGDDSLAVGFRALAVKDESNASNKINAARAIAMGYKAQTSAKESISIGDESNVTAAAERGIAVGYKAQAEGARSLSLGSKSKAKGELSIAIGSNEHSKDGTTASGKQSIAFGNAAKATAEKAMALGSEAEATGKNAVALGAAAKATLENSVALGQGTETKASSGNSYLTNRAFSDTGKVVSVGNRRINQLEDGAKDDEAVTVRQLKKVAPILEAQNSGSGITNNKIATNPGATIKVQADSWGSGDSRYDGSNLSTYIGGSADAPVVSIGLKENPKFKTLTLNNGASKAKDLSFTTDNDGNLNLATSNTANTKAKITNLADGTADSDAATVGQLKGATPTLVGQVTNGRSDWPKIEPNARITITGGSFNTDNNDAEKFYSGDNLMTHISGTNAAPEIKIGIKKIPTFRSIKLNNENGGSQTLSLTADNSGNLNVGSKRITGVSNATGDNDAVNYSQLKGVSPSLKAENAGTGITNNTLKTNNGSTIEFKSGDFSGAGSVRYVGENLSTHIGGTADAPVVTVGLRKDPTFETLKLNNGTGTLTLSTDNNGNLDVGNKKITGVANGTISATSTDAVNGSQLYTVKNTADTAKATADDVANKLTTLGDKKIGFNGNDGTKVEKKLGEDITIKGDDSSITTTAGNDAITIKVKDGGISTAKLADKAVTTAKLADGAVTATQLGDNAVTTAKLNDGAVTEAKLDDRLKTKINSANAVASNKISLAGDPATAGGAATKTTEVALNNAGGIEFAINGKENEIVTKASGTKVEIGLSETLKTKLAKLDNLDDNANNKYATKDETANKNLGNVTDAGKNVIKDAAREAVVVEAGTNITVTTNKDDTNHTTKYTVALDKDTTDKINNIGKVADGKDGKDAKPGADGTAGTTPAAGTHGLTGKDGLNGKDLTTKVNALRNGEAGTVVFTDAQGNRLVKANDGKYYKANEVGEDGNPKTTTGGATPTAVAEADIELRVVTSKGETKNTSIKLSNIADGKIDANSKDAINGSQLNDVASKLGLTVGADGKTLTLPTITGLKDATGTAGTNPNSVVAGLNEVIGKVNSGLKYNGDLGTEDTQYLGSTFKVAKATTELKKAGEKQTISEITQPAAGAAAGTLPTVSEKEIEKKYVGSNLITKYTKDATTGNGTLEIGFADSPEFNHVKANTVTTNTIVFDNGKGNKLAVGPSNDGKSLVIGDKEIATKEDVILKLTKDGTTEHGKVDLSKDKLHVASGNNVTVDITNNKITVGLDAATKAKLDKLDDNANDKYATKDETANKDLGNVTTDGKNVIKDQARQAVVVEAGNGIAVTTTEDATNHKTKYTVALDTATTDKINNIGKVSDGKDGKDAKPGAAGTAGTTPAAGTHGLTGKDGLNGKDLTTKVNALRNGEAGTVVFTDAQGNRLVKANDGKYYKPEFVSEAGEPQAKDGVQPTEVAETDIELRVVTSKGETKNTSIKLSNIADGKIAAGSKDAINGSQLNDVVSKLGLTVGADGKTLILPTITGLKDTKGTAGTSPTSVVNGLNDVIGKVNEGLSYKGDLGNQGTQQLGTVFNVNKAGSTITDGAGTTAVNYVGSNLITKYTKDTTTGNGKLEIGFKESPTFKDVTAESVTTKTLTFDDGKGNTLKVGPTTDGKSIQIGDKEIATKEDVILKLTKDGTTDHGTVDLSKQKLKVVGSDGVDVSISGQEIGVKLDTATKNKLDKLATDPSTTYATKTELDKKANKAADNLTDDDVTAWKEKLGLSKAVSGTGNLSIEAKTKGTVTGATETDNGKATVKLDGTENFKMIGTDGVTVAATGKEITFGLDQDTKDKINNVGKSTSDGRDGQNGDPGHNGANGLTAKDGLNGKDLTTKVNALRNGEAGTVVYTDAEGNRLVKANDGKYYKPEFVSETGAVQNNTAGETGVGIENPELRVVSVKGDTTTPNTLNNVASGLGLANTTGTTPTAITATDAKTAVSGLLTKTDELNKAVTVGDLQALAQAGLDFEGNAGTTHKALGTTLKIIGKDITGFDNNKFTTDYSTDNVATNVKNDGTVEIGFKKSPTFTKVKADEVKADEVKITKDLIFDDGKGKPTTIVAGDGKGSLLINGKKVATSDSAPVLYTDKNGNVVEKGLDGKIYKVTDLEGKRFDSKTKKYYDEDQFENGVLKEHPTELTLQEVPANEVKHALAALDDNSVTNAKVLTNVASGKLDGNSTEAVNGKQLKDLADKVGLGVNADNTTFTAPTITAINKADGTADTAKTKIVDGLNAVIGKVNEGIQYKGDSGNGTQQLGTVFNVNRAGSTLTETVGTNTVNYVGSNLITKYTKNADGSGKLEIGFKESPTFKDVTADSIKTTGNITAGGTITGKDGKFENLKVTEKIITKEIEFKDGSGNNLTLVNGKDGNLYINGVAVPSAANAPVIYTNEDGNRVELGQDGKVYEPKDLKGLTYVKEDTTKHITAGYYAEDQFEKENGTFKKDDEGNKILKGTATPTNLTNKEYKGTVIHKLSAIKPGDTDARILRNVADGVGNNDAVNMKQFKTVSENTIKLTTDGTTGNETTAVRLDKTGGISFGIKGSDAIETSANGTDVTIKLKDDYKTKLDNLDTNANTKYATKDEISTKADKDANNLTATDVTAWKTKLGLSTAVLGNVSLGIEAENKETATSTTSTKNGSDTLNLTAGDKLKVTGIDDVEVKVSNKGITVGLKKDTVDKINNIGKVSDGKDGKDAKPGAAGTAGAAGAAGTHGLTGKDGLNGKDLTTKVNALRNGEAGTVVFTDKDGNRLVKANDGNYYKAEEVEENGNPKTLAGGTRPTAVAEADIELRVVDSKGETKTTATAKGIKLSNIADGKIDANSKDAINGSQIKKVLDKIGVTTDANGNVEAPTITKIKDDKGEDPTGTAPTTLKDGLNAVIDKVNKGIKYAGDSGDGTQQLGTVFNVNAATGNLNKATEPTINYVGSNLITKYTKDPATGNGKLEIGFKESPTFKDVKADNITATGNITGKDGKFENLKVTEKIITKEIEFKDGSGNNLTLVTGKDGNLYINGVAVPTAESAPVIYTNTAGERVEKGQDGKIYKPEDIKNLTYVKARPASGTVGAADYKPAITGGYYADNQFVVENGVIKKDAEGNKVLKDDATPENLTSKEYKDEVLHKLSPLAGTDAKRLTNVADGKNNNDAVNMKQLNAVKETPIKFVGDDNQEVARKLGETLKINGDGIKVSKNAAGDGLVLSIAKGKVETINVADKAITSAKLAEDARTVVYVDSNNNVIELGADGKLHKAKDLENKTYIVVKDATGNVDQTKTGFYNDTDLNADKTEPADNTKTPVTVAVVDPTTTKLRHALNGYVPGGTNVTTKSVLTNVGAGKIDANSTDAINGSQLKAVADKVGLTVDATNNLSLPAITALKDAKGDNTTAPTTLVGGLNDVIGKVNEGLSYKGDLGTQGTQQLGSTVTINRTGRSTVTGETPLKDGTETYTKYEVVKDTTTNQNKIVTTKNQTRDVTYVGDNLITKYTKDATGNGKFEIGFKENPTFKQITADHVETKTITFNDGQGNKLTVGPSADGKSLVIGEKEIATKEDVILKLTKDGTNDHGTVDLSKDKLHVASGNNVTVDIANNKITVGLDATTKAKLDNLDANANDKYANKDASNITGKDLAAWKNTLGINNVVSGTGNLSIDAATKDAAGTETDNGKATVKLDGTENFKLLGTDGITVKGATTGPNKTLTFGLDDTTKAAIKNIGKSVSDGRDGKDATNGTNGVNGTNGLTAKDGLNGKDLTTKVNALRNGEAGTVVFTDKDGNRLVKANDGYYYEKSKVNLETGELNNPADAIKKATNGNYYKADKVEADGSLKTGTTDADIVAYNPELRVVNEDGSTTEPNKLSNVADGKIGVGSKDAINGSQIKNVLDKIGVTTDADGNVVAPTITAIKGKDGTNGTAATSVVDGLNKVITTVNSGIKYNGDLGTEDTQQLGSKFSVNRAGRTTVAGETPLTETIAATTAGATPTTINYVGDNVITKYTKGTDGNGKLEIGFKESPTFKNVTAENIDAINGKLKDLKVTDKITTKEIVFDSGTGTKLTLVTGKDGNLYINGVAVPTAENAPVTYTNTNGDRIELGQDGNLYKPADIKDLTYVPADATKGIQAGYYEDNQFEKLADGSFKQDEHGNKVLNGHQTPKDLTTKRYTGEVLHSLSPINKNNPSTTGYRLVHVADGKDNNDAVNMKQLNEVKNTPIKFVGDDGQEVAKKLGDTLNITGNGIKVTRNKAGDGLELSISKGKVDTVNVKDKAVTSAKLAEDARTVVYVTPDNKAVELGADGKLHKAEDLVGKTYVVVKNATGAVDNTKTGYYADADVNEDGELKNPATANKLADPAEVDPTATTLRHALNGYVAGGTNVTTKSILTNVGEGTISATSTDAINGAQFHKLSTNTIKLTANGVTTGGATTDKETNALKLDNTGGISFGIKGADGITTTANGTDVTVKLDATTKAKLDNLDANANDKYAKKDATNMTGLTEAEKAKWREAIGLENAVTGTGKLQIDAATKDAAGTETANGKATVKLDGTQNFKLVGKDGITVTGSNDEDNQTLTFGLDKDTTDKLKNITAVADGKDGKATNGTDGSNGSHGLTGKDGLNGKDLTTKVNALRNGEAGTVVFTDKAGNRLVKANDGKYYLANQVNENGGVITPAGGTTPTAVAEADIELRVVNSKGETATTSIKLSNIADGKIGAGSKDAINGSQIKDVLDKLGVEIDNTTGAIKQPTITAIKGADGKDGAATTSVVAGLNKVIETVNSGIKYAGDTGTGTQQLGSTFSVNKAGTTITNGTGTSAVNYVGDNLITKYTLDTATGNGKLEIGLKESPTFKDVTADNLKANTKVETPKVVIKGEAGADGSAGKDAVLTADNNGNLKVGNKTITAGDIELGLTGKIVKADGTETPVGGATDKVNLSAGEKLEVVGKDGVTVNIAGKSVTLGLDKDTTDKLKNITAVSDGKDGKATNGTDGSNGSHGLTGKDGLNGKDLTTKVNALRNGEAGTVVFTDKDGNRLVKANDGKYYLPNQVDDKGNVITTGGVTPTGVDNPELRVVNANGETTKPTALNNLASGLGLTNTTGATPTAITENDAKTTVNNLLTKTDGLNKAVNVGDLQALAQAGLNFTGNSGNAHAPLSTTVNVAGQGTPATGFVGASGNINVVASEDTTTANKIAKLEIQLAEALKGIKSIQNGDTKITLDKDNGVKVDGKDGGKVVVNGKDGKDGVTITGTDGTNGSSIVVNGKDGAAGKDSVTIKGGDGTNGSSIAVNGKDGKDGVTIKGTNGTDGSSIAVNGKDGKDGVTIKGTDGTNGSSIVVNGKDGKDGVTIKGGDGTNGATITFDKKTDAHGNTTGTGSITGLKDPEIDPTTGKPKDPTAATTVNYVTNQIEGAKTEITNKINNLVDGGMTYKGNSGDNVKVKLNEAVNIKGEGNYTGTGSATGNIAVVGDNATSTLEIKLNKDLKNIETISNGDTKITLDKNNGVKVDGTDGGKVVVNGKDGNSTVAINGGDGTNGSSIAVNGKDGKDGVTIKGTNGTDGSSIVVNGKDGAPGVTINGGNGTNGKDATITFTKDGANGTGSITGLKDPELNPDGTAKDKTAATTVNYVTNQITNVTNKINDVANKMDKGLNFVGNSGGTVNAKLDGTVSIKGEGTIATGIGTAANNITVEKDTTAGSTGLVVKLADKLTGMTGFETKEQDGKKVTIDKDGISLTTKATTGTPATNLKLGTDGTITGVVAKPDDKTSVATVGYVDSKIGSGITFGGDKGNNQAQELGTTLKVKAATETITANAKDYQGNEIKYKDQDGTDKNVTANYRGNNLITSYNYDTANKTGTISVAMSERPEFAAVTVGKGDTKATLDGEKGSLEFNKTIEKGKDGQPIVYANNDGKIVTYKDENGKIQPIYKQIGKGTISGLKDVDYLEVDGNRVAIDRTQAVNAGYVDDQLGDVRTRINNNTTRITELSTESRAGIAGVAAMANIPQINDAGSNKYNISVGIGKYRGETAYALGISGVSDGGRVVYKASAALDSQNKVTAGIGLGYQFGKRDIEASELDRFKAQMALLQTDSNKKFEKLEKEQQRMREEQEAIKATHNRMQEAIVAIDKKTDAIDKLNQMKMNQLEERINQKVEKIDSLNQLKINQINKEMEKVKNKLKIYK